MKLLVAILAAGIVCADLGCSHHPYSSANLLLDSAAQAYSTAANAIKPTNIYANPQASLGPMLEAYNLDFMALQIHNARTAYLVMGDAVQPSGQQHDALMAALKEIKDAADNCITNETWKRDMPPTVAVLLKDADSSVNQAYALVAKAPHAK